MSRFTIYFISAAFVCSGAFGQPALDRLSEISPELKLSDYLIRYERYIELYNKTYTLSEKLERLPTYIFGILQIAKLNAEEPEGGAKFGENHCTDMRREELANLTNMDANLRGIPEVDFVAPGNARAPSQFDWREKNAVTPVKNQGRCGSCWAFSTVSGLENSYAIKYKTQKMFSEQQLVDCDRKSHGCDGGWMDSAFQSVKDQGGLATAASYPYEGRQGRCRASSATKGMTLKKYTKLRSNDENAMASYIATISSTVNGINADTLQYYKGGVLSANRCDSSARAINHAVNVVGYTQDYWIVKNSWGTGWGEKGYFRIKKGNTCGISNYIVAGEVN